jgi:hypothetical protein
MGTAAAIAVAITSVYFLFAGRRAAKTDKQRIKQAKHADNLPASESVSEHNRDKPATSDAPELATKKILT